jgi:hypothetical protein
VSTVRPPAIRPAGFDTLTALGGALATVAAAVAADRFGTRIGLGAVAGAAFAVFTFLGFLRVPHVAVAVSIAVFTAIPALKIFVNPLIGSVKDLIIIVAAAAAIVLYIVERRPIDRWVAGLVGVLLALYVINAGGAHGAGWLQGVRLVGEPLMLLLIGMSLPDPQRVLRWAVLALVVSTVGAALFGILQQFVGDGVLLGWGYQYDINLRTINGHLRSFGPTDDPFAYAALLLFGLVAVLFDPRRKPWAWGAVGLITIGLAFSFVRTAAIIVVAIGGLLLVRRGLARVGLLLVVAAVLSGAVALLTLSGSTSSELTVSSSASTSGRLNLVLNGRVSAWTAAVGDKPGAWLLGRGVGTVGTAAQRAGYTFAPTSGDTSPSSAVDSGYLATLADVGLGGLAVLLCLFGRLVALAVQAARRGASAGWLALGLLVVLLMDALTRASFTGFPTAFLGLLLVGVALAAAREELAPPPAPAR